MTLSLVIGAVALTAAIGASLSFERRESAGSKSALPVPKPTASEPTFNRAIAVAPTPTAEPNDVLIAYAAMRDDINPKPRLQLIDAWARGAPPGARLDLLGQALVDPDETVRARAQELFDRQVQSH